MALPNRKDLITMDFVFKGQPFVNVPAKTGIDTMTMDYNYKAQPFVTNPIGSKFPVPHLWWSEG